ncbi:MAG: prepilin-type N-terminal cleavage/methylation domain-containing protein [Candidatus Omnitrophica bacterium]|nr:prepilin-type N-terminal cleavage/methylation domain-containing protein [Candidatus Omnitrophota bacterium]
MSPFPHTCPDKNNKLGAFTLVELLIAVSIFSVVSIAIYSTFSSGASVLSRVKNIDLAQQKILLKTERFSRELRELPACRKQLFLGAKTKISFPGNSDYIPCRITYYFDDASSCFMRVADKLSQIITPEGKIDAQFKSKPVVFLSKVKEIKFSYLVLDLAKNEYKWIDEWQQDYLPVAVKLTVTSQTQEYVSTVFLPKA